VSDAFFSAHFANWVSEASIHAAPALSLPDVHNPVWRGAMTLNNERTPRSVTASDVGRAGPSVVGAGPLATAWLFQENAGGLPWLTYMCKARE